MPSQQDKDFVTITQDGNAVINFKGEVYRKEALVSAAYKFSGEYGVKIDTGNDGYFAVIFIPNSDETRNNLPIVVSRFCNEVLDQEIRLNIEERTGELRRIIFEHAFSSLIDKPRLKKKS